MAALRPGAPSDSQAVGPEEYQRRPFKDFTLNYVKEAKLGETLVLSGFAESGMYTMAGSHEDGSLCFTAQMTFEN